MDQKCVRLIQLRKLGPGDMFQRESGDYRYVVSSKQEGSRYEDGDVYCFNIDGKSVGYWMPGDMRVRPMPIAEEVVESPPKTFYMCFVKGQGVPALVHSTSAAGVTEAMRLAETTGRKVFLLRAASSVEYDRPVRLTEGPQWAKLYD